LTVYGNRQSRRAQPEILSETHWVQRHPGLRGAGQGPELI